MQKKNQAKKINEQPIDQRVVYFLLEQKKLLDLLNLELISLIVFPERKNPFNPPTLSRIVGEIIKKQGGMVDFALKENQIK